jgi:ABC-type sugar transport system permease subunit
VATQAKSLPSSRTSPPTAVIINSVWNVLIALVSLYASVSILRMEGDFYGLGAPVQVFAALVAFIPVVLAVFSTIRMAQRKPNGRYVALILDGGVAVLSGLALLHLWGVFIGIDDMAQALYTHSGWLIGIAVAYALFWLGSRLGDGTDKLNLLHYAAMMIGGLSLILLLFFGGAVQGVLNIISLYDESSAVVIVTFVFWISAALGGWMLHEGDYFGETLAQQEAWQGWLMLSPNIIGFMLFFAGPLLLSFYLSFTNDTVGNVPDFIGLQNYFDIVSLQVATQTDLTQNAQSALTSGYETLVSLEVGGTRYVLGAKDKLFWYSLRNTIMYCFLLIPLAVLPALGLAMLMNTKLPGMKIYRAVYFLPSVAAVVGTALIWRWLYDPVIGYINYAITQVVSFLNGTLGWSVTDPKIEWLTNEGTVLFALVLMGAWQLIGFNTVLFLAGLQGIPRILYEAAFVDGASTVQRFRLVTLPLLAPTTFFILITTIISGLQVFNEPYALISQRPMPLNATTAVYYLYNRGFFRFEFGYASAVAWILFGLIFTVTLIQFRIQQRQGFDAYTGG